MSHQTDGVHGAGRRPLWLWVGIAVAALIVVALIIASIVAGNAAPTAESSTTPSDSSSAPAPEPTGSDEPAPSDSASPTPSAAPTEDPEEPDDSEVEPTPRPTRPPVDIDEPAKVEKGVAVRLTSIRSIEGTVNVPGEQAGPAILITVKAVNRSHEEISTPAVIVNVYYGDDQTPAGILTRPRTDFPTVLDAGGSASGQFAFTVPSDQRDRIRVEVDLSVGSPVVLFEGSVS